MTLLQEICPMTSEVQCVPQQTAPLLVCQYVINESDDNSLLIDLICIITQ